ncbi:hypothetical protein cyc_09238 [Cyclospora cayetanensis]|uniref:Transmembrane protein n=1 Tax=Cyclospora cayetanensis TaxID=88456 RepID=A0A1D3CV47_9EIME|nr:hypothetical protein cyc_09238 [Cyclospora cayetanensis]
MDTRASPACAPRRVPALQPPLLLHALLVFLLMGAHGCSASNENAAADARIPSLRFPELQLLYNIARGHGESSFPLDAYRAAKKVYAGLLQQAQKLQQHRKELRHEQVVVSTAAEPAVTSSAEAPSTPRFVLTEIPGYVLGGAVEVYFACRLHSSNSGGESRSALLCSGQPPPGQRAVEASLDFQLLPSQPTGVASTEASPALHAGATATSRAEESELVCKIGLSGFRTGEVHQASYIQGVLGLCLALGFRRQVYVHPNVPFLEDVPELSTQSLTTLLGFRVTPSRYVQFPFSTPVAAVNPNPPLWGEAADGAPSEEGLVGPHKAPRDEATVGDLLPFDPLSALPWRGAPVDATLYTEALEAVRAGLQKAVLVEGPSLPTAHNCSLRLGLRPQDFEALRSLGDGVPSCTPGGSLLMCSKELHQLPWNVNTQRLIDLLRLQLEALVPRVGAQAPRMVHLLRRPGIWLLLRRLLGGPAAARGEHPHQRVWYDGGMQMVTSKNYKGLPFNMMGRTLGQHAVGLSLRRMLITTTSMAVAPPF